MGKILRSAAGLAGATLKALGYGLMAFMGILAIGLMFGASYVGSETIKPADLFLAWFFKMGPNVLAGIGLVWLGGVVLKFSGGQSSDAAGAGNSGRKALSAAAQAVLGLALLFALGLGWMFASSFSHNRGYKADKAYMSVGVGADTVLMHLGHADRVSVDWVVAPGAVQPEASFSRPGKGIPRPLDGAGKPLGIAELRAEYRIVAFFRKFITVSFDGENVVSGVKEYSLD